MVLGQRRGVNSLECSQAPFCTCVGNHEGEVIAGARDLGKGQRWFR